jgi:DNA-directed RNA polymerase subunit beta'
MPADWAPGQPVLFGTTLGRALFNEALPSDYAFVNHEVSKRQLGTIVNDLAERYTKVDVAASLDALKDTGFYWATRSGVTISIEDVVTPPRKQEILATYEDQAAKVQQQFDRGLITDEERRQELIEIWTQATNVVGKEMEKTFEKTNPIYMTVHSGARGNMMQVRQIAAMRGLVANPKGEIIPRPIKANFREGLSVVEYFISTHGARKGLADTALRTADSGYLTRRLVDVSQDVIIREDDCGSERGLIKQIGTRLEDGRLVAAEHVETSAYARSSATAIEHPQTGEVLVEAGATSVTCRSPCWSRPAWRRSGSARFSPVTPRPEPAPSATAARWPPASSSTSARRSASSPPSRSVSRHAADHAYVPHRWCGR